MVSVMLYPCMFYVFDSVCELFGEKNRNMCGCVCYFVVECDGVVKCGWRCSIGYAMYGLTNKVCAVPAVQVSVSMLLPYVLNLFLYVGSYLLI